MRVLKTSTMSLPLQGSSSSSSKLPSNTQEVPGEQAQLLETMTYKELQNIAMRLDLPANLKSSLMIDMINAHRQGQEDVVNDIIDTYRENRKKRSEEHAMGFPVKSDRRGPGRPRKDRTSQQPPAAKRRKSQASQEGHDSPMYILPEVVMTEASLVPQHRPMLHSTQQLLRALLDVPVPKTLPHQVANNIHRPYYTTKPSQSNITNTSSYFTNTHSQRPSSIYKSFSPQTVYAGTPNFNEARASDFHQQSNPHVSNTYHELLGSNPIHQRSVLNPVATITAFEQVNMLPQSEFVYSKNNVPLSYDTVQRYQTSTLEMYHNRNYPTPAPQNDYDWHRANLFTHEDASFGNRQDSFPRKFDSRPPTQNQLPHALSSVHRDAGAYFGKPNAPYMEQGEVFDLSMHNRPYREIPIEMSDIVRPQAPRHHIASLLPFADQTVPGTLPNGVALNPQQQQTNSFGTINPYHDYGNHTQNYTQSLNQNYSQYPNPSNACSTPEIISTELTRYTSLPMEIVRPPPPPYLSPSSLKLQQQQQVVAEPPPPPPKPNTQDHAPRSNERASLPPSLEYVLNLKKEFATRAPLLPFYSNHVACTNTTYSYKNPITNPIRCYSGSVSESTVSSPEEVEGQDNDMESSAIWPQGTSDDLPAFFPEFIGNNNQLSYPLIYRYLESTEQQLNIQPPLVSENVHLAQLIGEDYNVLPQASSTPQHQQQQLQQQPIEYPPDESMKAMYECLYESQQNQVGTKRACRYHDNGCKEKLTAYQAMRHEKECQFQTLRCPLDACHWGGRLKRLSSHVREVHEQQISCGPENSFCFTLHKLRTQGQLHFVQEYRRRLFVLSVVCEGSQIRVAMQEIMTPVRTKKRPASKASLEVIGQDGRPHSWTGKLRPVQEGVHTLFANNQCLTFSLDDIGAFVGATAKIHAVITA